MKSETRQVAIDRALAAIAEHTEAVSLDDPFAGAIARTRAHFGMTSDPSSVIDHWAGRSLEIDPGLRLYPWFLTYERSVNAAAYAGEPTSWTAWRVDEQPIVAQDPVRFAASLTFPIVLTENFELLGEIAAGTSDGAGRASRILDKVEPLVRRDFASFIQASHPWTDTFGLWCLARRPRSMRTLHPIAVGIAETYAASAARAEGMVVDTRYPFHGRPLVSAGAHLAAGLWQTGLSLKLLTSLVEFVRNSARPSGGWGDSTSGDDVLTTLVVADLLAHIDPSFDLESTSAYLISEQEETGWWRALGPEMPWLTGVIISWLKAADEPFAHRFRWPHYSTANLDRKTGLPSYGYFLELSALLDTIHGLASAPLEVAFIDLAAFKKLNDRYGQERGDEVLAAFADELRTLKASRSIRDGGDEFLVIGAPGRSPLAEDLDQLRQRWPERLRKRFPDQSLLVAPRILVGQTTGASLVTMREVLGREIGRLKDEAPQPPAEGVLSALE